MKKSKSTMSIILVGILLQLTALCLHSRAAAGDVDLSFDSGSGVNGLVKVIVPQDDGKVMIAGQFTTVSGLARQSIARLNANGDGDATFNAGTNVDRYVSAVALQSDGKVIFTRDFYNLAGGSGNLDVKRLNADGTLDNSFAPAIGIFPHGSGFTCVAVQSDGKIVIGGYFNYQYVDEDGFVFYFRRSVLIRLNANGSSDNTFTNGNGTLGGPLSALALQSDGKILIAGDISTSINGTNYYGVARLNADGTLDTSFVPGVDGFIRSVAVQPDGKSFIGGNYIGSGTNRNAIARLNPDGSLDGSFLPGMRADSSVVSLAVQPDGKVTCIGPYIYVNGTNRDGLVRLNSDGSVDAAFNATTGAPNNSGGVIAVQPDGKIFIGAEFTLVNGTNRERIARLNSDGSLDNAFDPGASINAGVRSVASQTDGKVIFGGDFTIAGGARRNRVARLNANGTLDSSFAPGAGIADEFFKLQIASIVRQPDSKVLIGGDFGSVDGTNRNRIARLNGDASLDSSFIPGIGTPGGYSLHIATLVLQADGKLLVGGDPSFGNGTNQNGIARLNANGRLDASFHPNTIGITGGDYTGINSVVVQPDGKILAGGYFVSVLGGGADYPEYLLTRLNADGSRDSNFNSTLTDPEVLAIALQSDGKVLVATGTYEIWPGPGIARLNSDGTPDNTFVPGSGANGPVNSIAVQPDGKILIGGSFTAFNGTNRNRIARLHVNGSLDPAFNPGPGADGAVRSIVLQPDGNVLIAGDFTTINGVVRPHLARLYGDSVAPLLNITRSGGFATLSWAVAALNFQLQKSTNPSLTNSWSMVAQSPVTNEARVSVAVPASEDRLFFRLQFQ